MQISHLSRFDHDLYRGLIWTYRDYRIKSYQIASHLDVNRDNRGFFLSAKNFATITTIGGTIVTIASDRMTS